MLTHLSRHANRFALAEFFTGAFNANDDIDVHESVMPEIAAVQIEMDRGLR